jgi:hypothetical protein
MSVLCMQVCLNAVFSKCSPAYFAMFVSYVDKMYMKLISYAYVIKNFSHNLGIFVISYRIRGKPFQKCLMFVGKVGAYPSEVPF